MPSGATLATTSGNLTLTANQQALATSGNFYGVDVQGTVQAVDGAVSVSGRGGDGGTDQYGVHLNTGRVITTGSGAVSVTGIGGAGGVTRNSGVLLEGAGAVISSGGGGGNVSVTGLGGGSGGTSGDWGVAVGGTITAGGGGTVAVQGTGGTGTGGSAIGVFRVRFCWDHHIQRRGGERDRSGGRWGRK